MFVSTLFSCAAVAALGQGSSISPTDLSQDKPLEGLAASSEPVLSLGEPDSVLLDTSSESGAAWAVGRTWKARFGANGATFVPYFGADAPTNYPIRFHSAKLSVGGNRPQVSAAQLGEITTDAAVLNHVGFQERYLLGMEGIEQTFVIEALGGSAGDLSLTMDVETELSVEQMADGSLLFRGAYGEVTYGTAFAYDATGARTDVATWLGQGSIRLTVPADFVANAALPITIDPIVQTSTTFANESYDEVDPDITFDEMTGQKFISYQRIFSATDTDVYVRRQDLGGTTPSAISVIDSSLSVWSDVRIANLPDADQCLVVGSVVPDDPSTEDGVIQARTIDCATQLVGSVIDVSLPGSRNNVRPDVSGDAFEDSASGYLVTWVREFSLNDSDIHGRVIGRDGVPITGRIDIDNSGSNDDVFVSAGNTTGGNATHFLVSWERNGGGIFAQRVGFDGSLAGTTPFLVSPEGSRPSVSSWSRDFSPNGFRFALIAYEAPDEAGSSIQSIFTSVVESQDVAYAPQNLSRMEDFRSIRSRTQPNVVLSYGAEFGVLYTEAFNSADRDIYLAEGSVVRAGSALQFALSRRHLALAVSVSDETGARGMDPREFNANPQAPATAVWQDARGTSSDGSAIEFGRFIPVAGAIGVQTTLCSAESNASSNSSWMYALGSNQAGGDATLFAFDMPPSVFGFFIVSSQTSNVLNPGGSAGRLCLGGSIGRYTNSIFTSNPDGEAQVGFNFTSVPQPQGFVSVTSGQQWFFQAWHRDSAGGQATSNFTNALAISFE